MCLSLTCSTLRFRPATPRRIALRKNAWQDRGAIIVCAIPGKAYEQKVEFTVIVSTCAGENILLAAEALGLGVWPTAYPYHDRMDFLKNVIPLNVSPIGYTMWADKSKDKFKPDNIRWEKW